MSTAKVAKVSSLAVRPLQASHLCFEISGVLEGFNTELGAEITPSTFDNSYTVLSRTRPPSTFPDDVPPEIDRSRLYYDSENLLDAVQPYKLATLRAEAGKAALDKAVNARQNAYFAKYGNARAIITQMREFYWGREQLGGRLIADWDTKRGRISRLRSISTEQWDLLKEAYEAENRPQVVKYTQSKMDSKSSVHDPRRDGEDHSKDSIVTQHQDITNTDYTYKVPYCEAEAQYQRAQISLIDQEFEQFMFVQNLPNLERVFQNELNSIDNDVYQLQISLLKSVLMSPIGGRVTGIYKNPGDWVRVGEPVIRVENDHVVLLVATLIYRGPISIGSSVAVKTALFDSSSLPITVKGSTVAVRGKREDDHWEVIVKCDNLDEGGKPIFPLGYHFDYDDTTVSII